MFFDFIDTSSKIIVQCPDNSLSTSTWIAALSLILSVISFCLTYSKNSKMLKLQNETYWDSQMPSIAAEAKCEDIYIYRQISDNYCCWVPALDRRYDGRQLPEQNCYFGTTKKRYKIRFSIKIKNASNNAGIISFSNMPCDWQVEESDNEYVNFDTYSIKIDSNSTKSINICQEITSPKTEQNSALSLDIRVQNLLQNTSYIYHLCTSSIEWFKYQNWYQFKEENKDAFINGDSLMVSSRYWLDDAPRTKQVCICTPPVPEDRKKCFATMNKRIYPGERKFFKKR